MDKSSLITGEHRRVYDDRYRIALPPECMTSIAADGEEAVLAKEREGCLSLWNVSRWQKTVEGPVGLLEHKLSLQLLDRESSKVQRFVRLLSTRSKRVKLGQRSRLLVPEGFREFLNVEPNSEVIVVGAGVCLEIWNPIVWTAYLREDLSQFHSLFQELTT